MNFDVTSMAFSFGFNFMLMMVFTLVEARLKPALASSYFDAAPFEKQGRFYESLGVKGYIWFLKAIGWEKLRQAEIPIKKRVTALQAYERATRVSETGHLLIAAVVAGVTVYVVVTYSALDAIWLILLNVLLNIYPILAQRYNRPRLRAVIRKFQAAETRI